MVGLDEDSREMMINSIKAFAERHFPEAGLLDHDRKDQFISKERIKEMYDPTKLGINLLMIPAEYGGIGASTFDMYQVCEVLAGIDLGVATSVFATFLGMDPLRVGGTPEQKKKWFSRLASEGLLCAYGATEAEAGSDLGALKTRALPMIEDGVTVGYRITGSKQWISNGGIADMYLILAKDTKALGWFIVERGTEGMEFNNPEEKHGIRLANTVAFSLDNVFVPADNLVGLVEGQGLTQAQAVFGFTRVMVAAFGLGCGWAALGRAVSYSQGRIQGGGPLSEKQGYTHKLIVPNAVRLEAARAYIEYVAMELDRVHEGFQTEGAIAKWAGSEAGNKAAEDSIQALGGYGYVHEMIIEKIKRDVRITCIYEGTNEILEMTIARDRWQEHLKSRGAYFFNKGKAAEELHISENKVGADLAANALKALSNIYELCRVQKLTRNQHVLMRLGELAAWGETAFIFGKMSAEKVYSKAVKFDRETWQAMSRVYSRDAALRIAEEGIKLVLGYGEGEPALLRSYVNMDRIMEGQKGRREDMDLIAERLTSVFKMT
ncbi:MAG: acyl-CoA dehydrogenase family protein [Candidatus Thermoplasmatota archaeon]|nr:acyl-CoA dehydrogenase family protein [Candidatus Thermoplasmatota archaeon]